MEQAITPKVDMRKLPALAKVQMGEANYPELYRAARSALRECVRVDEIKEIKDKHSAIAHYAKQVKDQSLLNYAKRIKLRAYSRIGELLSAIDDESVRKMTVKSAGLAPSIASKAQAISRLPEGSEAR